MQFLFRELLTLQWIWPGQQDLSVHNHMSLQNYLRLPRYQGH